MERRRIKHKVSFEERLAEEAERFRKAAEDQPAGSTARELLLRRARQAETAAHMSDWLRSPGLQPPRVMIVARMDGFYAYIVDPNGHVLRRVDLAIESEEVARERAKQLVDGHDVELWQLDRKIATFTRNP